MSYLIVLQPEIAPRGYCVRNTTGDPLGIAAAGFGLWAAGHHVDTLVKHFITDVGNLKHSTGAYRDDVARRGRRKGVEHTMKDDAGPSLEELAAGVGWAIAKNIQGTWHDAHEVYTRDSRAASLSEQVPTVVAPTAPEYLPAPQSGVSGSYR